jgi:hypothetical protein
MNRPSHKPAAGFSLFEILIALGIFALAFMGLALSLDSAITAGLEARSISRMRAEMDNRLAFCLAQPPDPGVTRKVEAKDNRGVSVEETLEPFLAQNREEEQLPGLWLLKIKVGMDDAGQTAETLLYIP